MRVVAALLVTLALLACGGPAPQAERDEDGRQEQAGTGGYATLTAGDEVWTFSEIFCDPAEGQAFMLQGVEDPVNVLVVVDRVNGGESHFIQLYNHVDREHVLGMGFATPRDFLRVDGKAVSGEVELVDNRPGADLATVLVTFEGSCP